MVLASFAATALFVVIAVLVVVSLVATMLGRRPKWLNRTGGGGTGAGGV